MDVLWRRKWIKKEVFIIAMPAHFQFALIALQKQMLFGRKEMCLQMKRVNGKIFDFEKLIESKSLFFMNENNFALDT